MENICQVHIHTIRTIYIELYQIHIYTVRTTYIELYQIHIHTIRTTHIELYQIHIHTIRTTGYSILDQTLLMFTPRWDFGIFFWLYIYIFVTNSSK